MKGDPRIFIDPNKTDKGEKRYADCYIDGDLLIKITRDEYGQIRNEIQDLAPEDEVPSVINRISTLYPEVASKLAAWCELEDNSDLNKILVQVDNWDTDNKLAYIPTTEELNSLINVPNIAYIYLSVDYLCEIPNYTNLCYTNNILIGDSKSVVQSWYDGISDADSKVHELRNKQYTRILAHEMAHIFYKLNNKVNAYKWDLLRAEFELESCYPGKHGLDGISAEYCSAGPGHEYKNQDGLETCAESEKYSKPCLNQ